MDGRGAAGTADTQWSSPGAPAGRTSGVVAGVVAGGVAVAGTAVLALHAIGATAIDPIALTVSDYVAVPGGPALLGLAAAGLVTAGAALLRAAPRRGWPRPVAALLALWCLALVLVAVFPTNAVGTAPDLASVVHRWAGAVVFAVPPVAGLLVARRARAARAVGLGRWSAATGVAGIAFLLSHAPAVLAGAPPFPLLGLVERLAYLAMLGMIVVFGRATAAEPVADPAPAPSTPPAVAG